jgi:hypothetical protein
MTIVGGVLKDKLTGLIIIWLGLDLTSLLEVSSQNNDWGYPPAFLQARRASSSRVRLRYWFSSQRRGSNTLVPGQTLHPNALQLRDNRSQISRLVEQGHPFGALPCFQIVLLHNLRQKDQKGLLASRPVCAKEGRE